MGTLIVLLWACWLLLIIGQIAISDAGVSVSCLLQESDRLRVYASQNAEQACLPISFRAVGFLKINIFFS
mgnify:CR=1 FL=1